MNQIIPDLLAVDSSMRAGAYANLIATDGSLLSKEL